MQLVKSIFVISFPPANANSPITFNDEHSDKFTDINDKDINQEAIEKACKIANLHDFITKELTFKYQTTIGERGVRLSGGQIQRIGIARALYHNPYVLVLDEATSALDNLTEKAVVDAINNLNKKITIILIAHRLNTVKNCDIIYKFEKGQIVSQGTYNEIINVT